ncbi:hypothetical protein GJ496_002182 [Pomphorhynchus laevis]|nr:hypothetical protein GJ496_002182 [Pomphorhynchus laevis]
MLTTHTMKMNSFVNCSTYLNNNCQVADNNIQPFYTFSNNINANVVNHSEGSSVLRDCKRDRPLTSISVDCQFERTKETVQMKSINVSNGNRQKLRRLKANHRERGRMHDLNGALEKLKCAIPNFGQSRKLSKIDTLRLATNYIGVLNMILSTEFPLPPEMITSELCKGLSHGSINRIITSPASNLSTCLPGILNKSDGNRNVNNDYGLLIPTVLHSPSNLNDAHSWNVYSQNTSFCSPHTLITQRLDDNISSDRDYPISRKRQLLPNLRLQEEPFTVKASLQRLSIFNSDCDPASKQVTCTYNLPCAIEEVSVDNTLAGNRSCKIRRISNYFDV